jgi:D-3-phosphoglycerate dehydrogenase/(S)-sulfolactate dehydrogenase
MAATMARVLVTTLFIRSSDDPSLEPLRRDGHAIEVVDGTTVRSEAALTDKLQGIAATLASTEPYTEPVLAQAPQLKVISRTGVGYDAIDVPAATRHGVLVCTTPGTNHHAVADLALTLILAQSRRLLDAVSLLRSGKWTPQPVGFELRGATVGIIGTGLIGREVAKRLFGFEPRLIAYDVVQNAELARTYNVEYVSLDRLFAESDVVTVHAPLLPETRNMIDAAALGKMKPTAYLVNTARGPLVDEQALARALEAGTIAGAALDVMHVEPLPADSPLRQAPNLLLTPHIASSTYQSIDAMKRMAVENAARVLRGDQPLSSVNPAVLSSPARR